MAIFQFNMQVIGRSEGRSVVSAAAYRAAEKINNDYTGTIDDYTRKKWVAYSEQCHLVKTLSRCIPIRQR